MVAMVAFPVVTVAMQASMGYIPGQGLGRENTGIVDPIQESLHKGRQGLGFNLEGLEREDVQWELEEVYVMDIDNCAGWVVLLVQLLIVPRIPLPLSLTSL
jgi:hypothetical protein